MKQQQQNLVVCVKNYGYEVSLERRKIYDLLPDEDAEGHGQVRVIDESGEDYLYPAEFFVRLDLPKETQEAVIAAV